MASASARHGLRTLQTFPKSTESSGIPSQKITRMNVGAKFRSSSEVPKSAVAIVRTSRPTENAPSTIRTRAREDDRAEQLREAPSGRRPLEQRLLPERAEEDERDDEDDGGGREEERLRDREIPDAADPVRDVAHVRV